MKRQKMNYKVSELHHLFFNSALPDGAKAGELARYSGGVLYHSAGEPAAAFLSDARAADGLRDVVVILPPCADGQRWSAQQLESAVPETVHAVRLPRWAYADQVRRYSVPNARTLNGEHAGRVRSAADLCAAYTAAIAADCKNAAHSALDAAGESPYSVPHYAASVRALLALAWTDGGARERARAALQAVLDHWQLGHNGEYEKSIVQAISQREKVAEAAAAALPKVRAYFSERAALLADKSPAGFRKRLSFARNDAPQLTSAIRDILRADLPPALLAGLPQNIAGTVNADLARAKRAAAYLSAPQAVSAAYANSGRCGPSLGPAEFQQLPKWARQEIDKAHAQCRNCERRERVRNELKEAAAYAQRLQENAPAILAAAASLETDAPDYAAILAADGLPSKACRSARRIAEIISQAAAISRGNDPAFLWPLEIEPAALEDQADKVHQAALEYRQREKWNIEAAEIRAGFADWLQQAETRPRQVIRAVDQLLGRLTGWSYREAPAALVNALEKELHALRNDLILRTAAVSEIQEYENGGNAPQTIGGDWLLIKGGTATTNHGARVPVRAIRAAFAFIDTQPAGAFDCRELEFKIGDFQLYGRTESGAVRVGCHTFSAEAVEHIRAQLARASASGDQEAAA